tara:strand:+ start:40 stop:1236 length:1197 start_codon:yes stop_codon:yes gene_type:complete
MGLNTRTTKQIADNIIANLEASLNQSIPLLAKSFMRVLSTALAGVVVLLYKYAGFMFLQQFVQTATFKSTEINGVELSPLVEHGRLVGVGDPTPATQAELTVDITVTNAVGTLPSGSQLVNTDNGVTYITIGAVLLNASTVSALIRAVNDQADAGGAGAIGNLSVSNIVSFVNPLANVSRDTVVTAQVVVGADGETEAAYRQRVLDRFQKRPEGGAYSDYQLWATGVAGILNSYPYTSACPGQVDVFVEATVASSGSPDGIPTTVQLEEVLAAINFDDSGLASRRPANALANTFAIDRLAFDLRVTGLTVGNLADVQASITTALEEYFLSREPYIIGLSVPPREDRITRSATVALVENIVNDAGGVFSTVLVSKTGVSIESYVLGIGEKAKADTVVFT